MTLTEQHVPTKEDNERMEKIRTLKEAFESGKCGLYDFIIELTEVQQQHLQSAAQSLS